MANPERLSAEQEQLAAGNEHSGYVFGPTPPALSRNAEGIITGPPDHEAADYQNQQTTLIEIQLARHHSGIEPLSAEKIAEVSKEHRDIAGLPKPIEPIIE